MEDSLRKHIKLLAEGIHNHEKNRTNVMINQKIAKINATVHDMRELVFSFL